VPRTAPDPDGSHDPGGGIVRPHSHVPGVAVAASLRREPAFVTMRRPATAITSPPCQPGEGRLSIR